MCSGNGGGNNTAIYLKDCPKHAYFLAGHRDLEINVRRASVPTPQTPRVSLCTPASNNNMQAASGSMNILRIMQAP